VLLAALLLSWPILLIGHPATTPDTRAYLLVGQAALDHFHLGGAASHGAGAASPLAAHHPDRALTQAAARSPYFGVFLYLTAEIATPWATIALQSLLVAWVCREVCRLVCGVRSTFGYLVVVALLAAGSSAGFYDTLLMPDLFCGVGLCAALLVVFAWDRLVLAQRVALLLLLAACASFHATNAICAGAVAAVGLGARAVRPTAEGGSWRGAAAAIAALVVGGGALAAYPLLARLAIGQDIYHPPFLMARLVADGEGRRYLQRACDDGAAYALCGYRHLPLARSDDILWSEDPRTGVYLVASPATRAALAREEGRFVMGVVTTYPIEVVSASARNTLRQALLIELNDIADYPFTDYFPGAWRFRPIPDGFLCERSAGQCPATRGERLVDAAEAVVLALSVVVLVVLAIRPQGRRPALPGRTVIVAVLAAVAVNDVVCASFSEVAARYSMRVAWVIPLMAIAALVGRPGRR
jgi:hypothetical protein